MADSPQSEEQTGLPDSTYKYQLPQVSSFEEVNRNFDDVSETITVFMNEMKRSHDVMNGNLLRLAEETSQNLSKLATDLKAVLSSQSMMFVIFFTVVGLVVMLFKSIWEAFFGPIG